MFTDTNKLDSLVYRSLKIWFIEKVYARQARNLEEQYKKFLESDTEIETEFTANRIPNSEKLAIVIKDFFSSDKENSEFRHIPNYVYVQHGPDSLLTLADLFIVLEDVRIAGELIFAAAVICLKEFARPLLPPITSHQQLRDVAYVLSFNEVFADGWYSAEECHSRGYYDDTMGIRRLKDHKMAVEDFVREFQRSREALQHNAEVQARIANILADRNDNR